MRRFQHKNIFKEIYVRDISSKGDHLYPLNIFLSEISQKEATTKNIHNVCFEPITCGQYIFNKKKITMRSIKYYYAKILYILCLYYPLGK